MTRLRRSYHSHAGGRQTSSSRSSRARKLPTRCRGRRRPSRQRPRPRNRGCRRGRNPRSRERPPPRSIAKAPKGRRSPGRTTGSCSRSRIVRATRTASRGKSPRRLPPRRDSDFSSGEPGRFYALILGRATSGCRRETRR
jgi:hypothetical protein